MAGPWLELKPFGQAPADTLMSASCVLPDSTNLFMFGGRNSASVNFCQLQGKSEWKVGVDWPEGNLASHSCVATSRGVHVFGGKSAKGLSNSLLSYDPQCKSGSPWSTVESSGDTPSPRYAHTATTLNGGSAMVVFGGCSGAKPHNDLFVFDVENGSWEEKQLANPPPPRYHHSLTDIGDGTMVMFGGTDGVKKLDDLYVLDTKEWSWRLVDSISGTLPVPRSEQAAASDSGFLIIHGGVGPSGLLTDTFLFDLASKRWKKLDTSVPLKSVWSIEKSATLPGRLFFVGASGSCVGIASIDSNALTSVVAPSPREAKNFNVAKPKVDLEAEKAKADAKARVDAAQSRQPSSMFNQLLLSAQTDRENTEQKKKEREKELVEKEKQKAEKRAAKKAGEEKKELTNHKSQKEIVRDEGSKSKLAKSPRSLMPKLDKHGSLPRKSASRRLSARDRDSSDADNDDDDDVDDTDSPTSPKSPKPTKEKSRRSSKDDTSISSSRRRPKERGQRQRSRTSLMSAELDEATSGGGGMIGPELDVTKWMLDEEAKLDEEYKGKKRKDFKTLGRMFKGASSLKGSSVLEDAPGAEDDKDVKPHYRAQLEKNRELHAQLIRFQGAMISLQMLSIQPIPDSKAEIKQSYLDLRAVIDNYHRDLQLDKVVACSRTLSLAAAKQKHVATDSPTSIDDGNGSLSQRNVAKRKSMAGFFKKASAFSKRGSSDFGSGELENVTAVSAAIDNDLENIEQKFIDLAMKMIHPFSGLDLRDHRRMLKMYPKTFAGSKSLDWIEANVGDVKTRGEAFRLMEQLYSAGLISHAIHGKQEFSDSRDDLYRFRESLWIKLESGLQISGPAGGGEGVTIIPMRAVESSQAGGDGDEEMLTPRDDDDAEGEFKKRNQVMKELMSTEADYVKDLQLIIRVYLGPLSGTGTFASLLTPTERSAVFSNVEMLLPINEELLDNLRALKKLPTSEQRVGQAFMKLSPYLKAYKQYCSKQDDVASMLQDMEKKNPQLIIFLDMMKKRPECRNLDFGSFMIKPLQRICKYPLLLRELVKVTPESHVDYPDLQAAFKECSKVVAEINEGKRSSESQTKVVEIQNNLAWSESEENPQLVTPTRRFVSSHKVKVIASNGTRRRRLILFNDLLIFVRAVSETELQLKQVYPLGASLLWDIPDGQLEGGKAVKNAFSIVSTDTSLAANDKNRRVPVLLTSKSNKDTLVGIISNLIGENTKLT